ncbi:type 2 isopentenyl-diphosphate Delta-isomerase [Heyndrickxia oleronia]|uniref:Isopentenyl-diphosphate delta-isomerase n=1 Tax=Heyndrickxia oleronia TaxID=38875 RepID=A0AAW6SWJ5_9BACI|nr:type 2 isopentenyl-diphosphate Delta-isomerase [Heyndrickxia oleronia]MCM3236225.1 type 2 isopentenyl-diphosphate Delta-isomerase [Heyndrickxia oleronia]MDH5162478.1 type 2 isopentenyl-diphosphate Delta-isomerase [Heyndrickxia oleronia]
MNSENQREMRKNEHVHLASKQNSIEVFSHFDDLHFVHHSLPEVNYEEIDITTSFANIQMGRPIYINAMTGGSKKTGEINALLAEIAKTTGLAMAVGSQHAGLRNEQLADTYKIVRQKHPNGIIFANIGADVPIDFARKAIDMVEANALQVHLNVPQELVMYEGERNFLDWSKKIEQLIKIIEIPIIIKEVGFGMSMETISFLHELGIQYIDISGRGGTNFIWVENQRNSQINYEYLNGWGQSTVISLLEAQNWLNKLIVFASGGVRNPLDIVKSFSLGARAVGIAGPILRKLLAEGVESTIKQIMEWLEGIQVIMTMLGAKNISDLQKCPIIVKNKVFEWCQLREIDVRKLANRSKK